MSEMPPPGPSPPVQSSPLKLMSPAAPPALPAVAQQPDSDKAAKLAEAQAKIAAFKAKMAKPPTPAQNENEMSSSTEPRWSQ